jgi:hypothetical protein
MFLSAQAALFKKPMPLSVAAVPPDMMRFWLSAIGAGSSVFRTPVPTPPMTSPARGSDPFFRYLTINRPSYCFYSVLRRFTCRPGYLANVIPIPVVYRKSSVFRLGAGLLR